MTPDEIAWRLKYGQDTLSAGRQQAANPQHWTQALAGALQMGIGGHYGANAQYETAQGKAGANKQLADLLASGADPRTAAATLMGNPWTAEQGQKLAMQEMDPLTALDRQKAQLGIDQMRADAALDPLRRQKLQMEMDALRQDREQMNAVNGMLTGSAPPAVAQPANVPTEGVGRFAQPAVAPSEPTMTIGNRKLTLPQAMQAATVLAKRNPAMAKYIMDEVKRAQVEPKLLEMGIDPASAEGQTYMLTGRLPAKAYEKMANASKRTELTGKVDAGLTNLLETAKTANDTSFESALGPFQGSTPDSLAGAVPINVARVFGEVANFFGGGNVSPSEVRSNITGATEALAAAIKPLIRGPGEGPWTDADQARLVSIVGDLAQARDKAEFRRRLNAVRDRVKANFGLDLKFDAGAGGDVSSLSDEDLMKRLGQ